MAGTRNLIVVLGDQLDARSAAFDGYERKHDVIWMAEAAEESEHVPSHKVRIAMFLSAMRHFRACLEQKGACLLYRELEDPANRGSLAAELERSIRSLRPQSVIVVEPGEYRVLTALQQVAERLNVPLDIRPDRHFLCSTDEFKAYAADKKQLRMEFFYREMRRKTGALMDDGEPAEGRWNFDEKNRGSFDSKGPGLLPEPVRFPPDSITQRVIEIVQRRFPHHPGTLDGFDFAVTPEQARAALGDFVRNRLPVFGPYQDAMWEGRPLLYHSRLSSAMNLKLLDPREAIHAAATAYRQGEAPLPSVEGYVRQILGWREYLRGVYWKFMPGYEASNALGAEMELPWMYWSGETEMNCMRQALGQTLRLGYAHHIQRLMVTGLYALLFGVRPHAVHEWYLAIYVDAVEWVEMPNTLGMSQFADGGLLASKPYIASGKYIDRMSNYCSGCRYDPAKATGADACPFTTLYWNFLMEHEPTLRKIPRMQMQLRNLVRIDPVQKSEIRRKAQQIRDTTIT